MHSNAAGPMCKKVAAAALAALPFLLGGVLPARSQPHVELTPLPWALSGELLNSPSGGQVDARAAAVGTGIRTAIQQARHRTEQTTAASGLSRRPSDRSAAPDARKVRSRAPAANLGQSRGPGAALRFAPPDFTVRMAQSGTIRSVQALPTAVLQRAVGNSLADDERTVRAFLKSQRPLLGLVEPNRELRLRTRHSDRLGHRYLRFEQTFDGLRVYGAELIAQLDEAGNLITLNGRYSPTPRKLVSRPVVEHRHAGNLVRSIHPGTDSSQGSLAVFLKDGTTPHLAWIFEVSVGLLETRLVAIDAHTGAVLADFNQVQSGSQIGSGMDLFGALQNLTVWEDSGVHFMVDTSKLMFDSSSAPPQLALSRGVIAAQDAANQPPTNNPQELPLLSSVTSANADGPWLPDAVSAVANLSATYEYFLTEHSRNSLDDNGGSLVAVVRLGQGFANALFDPSTQTMYFGDAQRYAGALDVVAHELAHGVVTHSAGLLYQNQSGALNEAFADIFGEMVEAHVRGQPDWLIGTALGSPLRNMANPGALDFAPGRPYPSRMSEFVYTSLDNGGVHINSGIVNHAFYQLAAGLPNAIGADAAAAIFYRTLTTKLTNLSDFTDARLGAIQSAEELFGPNSPEAARTVEAFDAVQIFDTPSNPPPPPYSGSDGTDATIFVYWDGVAGEYYLGRYEPSLGDTLPGIQLSLNPVSAAKPSVAGDGSFAVFVDSQSDICFITTDALAGESCIGFPGSTNSVAMSPDGSVIAFVLLDETGNPDNSINVVDIDTGQTRTFELVSPTFDGPSSVRVLSADALDLTADNRFVLYDAFNALSFADGPPIGLWSVYAIDLATEATLALLPPTVNEDGEPLDIAFPSIAQTSDNHMVFDVLDGAAGANYVFAANILTGELAIIGVTSTYATPGYTGDDSGIVYSVSDLATPTQFSLVKQRLANDRLTSSGPLQAWVADADYSAIYRRGNFSGPRVVDVSVSQSATTEPGHRARFSVNVLNFGSDAASAIQLAGVLPVGVVVSVNEGGADCIVVAAGHEVSCALPQLQSGAAATIEIVAALQSASAITSSITAFASEPDLDPSDNTSFNTVSASLLNFAPIVKSPIGGRTALVGSQVSIATADTFTDQDGDTLSYAAIGLPAGLAMNAGTGTISGAPASGTASTSPHVVQVTATDGFGGSAVDVFSLTVEPAPNPSSNGSSGGGGGGLIDKATLLGLLLLLMSVVLRRVVAASGLSSRLLPLSPPGYPALQRFVAATGRRAPSKPPECLPRRPPRVRHRR